MDKAPNKKKNSISKCQAKVDKIDFYENISNNNTSYSCTLRVYPHKRTSKSEIKLIDLIFDELNNLGINPTRYTKRVGDDLIILKYKDWLSINNEWKDKIPIRIVNITIELNHIDCDVMAKIIDDIADSYIEDNKYPVVAKNIARHLSKIDKLLVFA